MTHTEVLQRLERRGEWDISELLDLTIADLWYRMCAFRARTGKPMPADDLRPRLADPALSARNPKEQDR